MALTRIVEIVLERNGERRTARPASADELSSASESLAEKGSTMDSCECGEELCINGYVWRCAYGPEGHCQWFVSDWQCND